jgi:hypothetical protein
MPDLPGSKLFWSSVANTFKGNGAVIFDLFNEPFPDRALPNETSAWECWRDGGSYCMPGIQYPAAGMQTLIRAIRGTGANNVIMLGGLGYANDVSQWFKYEPIDPDHNLVASWHSYSRNSCSDPSCWNSHVAPVIARVPLIAGEIGETDCTDDYINPLMNWLDSQHTSYLAWSWNTGNACSQSSKLITSYEGDPSIFGAGFEAHLKAFAER